jgi:hypothetical protein
MEREKLFSDHNSVGWLAGGRTKWLMHSSCSCSQEGVNETEAMEGAEKE